MKYKNFKNFLNDLRTLEKFAANTDYVRIRWPQRSSGNPQSPFLPNPQAQFKEQGKVTRDDSQRRF